MDILLNGHVVAAALSGVFSVAAGIIYIKDILQGGGTKPNAVSFFLWTLLQEIAVIAQIEKGASLSLVIMCFVTFNTFVVTMLAVDSRYGYRKYGKTELFCLIFAVVAIVGLQVNPLLAIAFAIAGDFFAFVPTAMKTYREPRSEHVPAWALITTASVLGVLSTDRLDVANLAFPLYLVVSNGAIFSLAYFGRKKRVTFD